MARARPRPDAVRLLSGLLTRVAALERQRRPTALSPARVAAAETVTSTTPVAVFVAWTNPVGAQVSWSVLVTPTGGTTTTLRLRDDATSAVGPDVAADPSMPSVVTVILPLDVTWRPGDPHLVYLDALVDVGSATVLPVSAVVA